MELDMQDELPITRTQFLLAFAKCLVPEDDDDVEQILEKRAVEYRKVGKLFGMERVQQQFSWSKFWLTFLSDSCAFVAFPVCKVMDMMHPAPEEGRERPSLHEILTRSQWLPVPYLSFDSFQYYLMKLWLPSIISVLLYLGALSFGGFNMDRISAAEVLSPLVIYLVIGTYISFISGYEHPRMVLRRLNPCLSADLKMNELRAIFAFRAHTPEGHMVDQIGCIADFLFSPRFLWFSNLAAASAGMLHGLMPTFHRIYFHNRFANEEDYETPAVTAFFLGASPYWQSMWRDIVSRPYMWVCGGNDWLHPLISVPSTFISGYLTYRLLYITSVGFSNDLAFYNRLRLFRAMTQAEPFLRFRARWIRQGKAREWKGRTQFLQFLNLQKRDDLVLWCRIRQLLVESYEAGFRNKQGDIIVTMMLISVLALTSYIFFYQIRSENRQLSVLDLRARVDVFVFSLLLISVVNLKLSIHGLRKSDISLLHKEHYAAAMAECSGEHFNRTASTADSTSRYPPHKPVPQSSSRFAASFVRRKSVCSVEGSNSPLAVRPSSGITVPQGYGKDSPDRFRRDSIAEVDYMGMDSARERTKEEHDEDEERESRRASEKSEKSNRGDSKGSASGSSESLNAEEDDEDDEEKDDDDEDDEEGGDEEDATTNNTNANSSSNLSSLLRLNAHDGPPGTSTNESTTYVNNGSSSKFSSAHHLPAEREQREQRERERGGVDTFKFSTSNSTNNTTTSSSTHFFTDNRPPSASNASNQGPPTPSTERTTLLPPPRPSSPPSKMSSSPPPTSKMHPQTGSGRSGRRASFAAFYEGGEKYPPPPPSWEGPVIEDTSSFSVQQLLDHTARYIAEFDKPPRLLSFTVSIHFLRYIFLPLLSPIIAAFRAYAYGHTKKPH